jgi:hypothetical protein
MIEDHASRRVEVLFLEQPWARGSDTKERFSVPGEVRVDDADGSVPRQISDKP